MIYTTDQLAVTLETNTMATKLKTSDKKSINTTFLGRIMEYYQSIRKKNKVDGIQLNFIDSAYAIDEETRKYLLVDEIKLHLQREYLTYQNFVGSAGLK